MSGIGCYVKYEDPNSEYGECVFLKYVYDVWDNGYCSKTYIIDASSIYFEDASFTGFTLDHLKKSKRIKQKKFDAAQNIIANCRQELDYLGMTGERTLLPDIKVGDFYYSYCEDIEDGVVEEYFFYFYRIISVENNIVTYKHHTITDNNLHSETEKVYTKTIDDFFDMDDTRWYRITEEIYGSSDIPRDI